MSAIHNYQLVLNRIKDIAERCGRNPKEISLVIVTKNHPWSDFSPLYDAGHRDFGENRLQEALTKIQKTPADIQWHFIGTLQKNKVRKALSAFALIHSVDTFELAEKIADVSKESGIEARVLLQVNTSGEATKHGLVPEEWRAVFQSLLALPSLRIMGLMTMAPFTEDQALIRNCFAGLRHFRDELNADYDVGLKHLSMGMSHDYPLAIEEGATLLRIGSAIFEPFQG